MLATEHAMKPTKAPNFIAIVQFLKKMVIQPTLNICSHFPRLFCSPSLDHRARSVSKKPTSGL
jgi:hypothetical protein